MGKNIDNSYEEQEIYGILEHLISHYKLKITVSQLTERVYFKRYCSDIKNSSITLSNKLPTSTSLINGLTTLELQKLANIIVEADAILKRYGLDEEQIKLILKELSKSGGNDE